MKKIKVNRKLLRALKELRLQLSVRTAYAPVDRYDYELIELVLQNCGA